MLDAKLLRDEPDRVKRGIAAKKTDPALVDRFLELDRDWRAATAKLDELRATHRKFSAKVAAPEGGEPRPAVAGREEAKANKEEIKRNEEKLGELAKERDVVWAQIPNIPSEDTPVGKDESENKVLRTWGEPTKFDFEPKDHLALGERLGIIDTETAGKVSGTRFAYLKGDLALLEFALIEYGLHVLTNEDILKPIAESVAPGYSAKPFVPVIPPAMVRPDVFQKMARLEPREERYYIPSDDVYLVGSAEHTLGPLHMDETIEEARLPLRYVGFSTSFRREAGSYGKDTRGILRVHQFDKLEMESFTVPEQSVAEQNFFVAAQEHLMQSLGIPYRVVAICTGDMGGPDARQIDIESWMPGQNRYRETHTADLMTDYQARRLGTKIRRGDNRAEFAHMNDATAFAVGRTLIAILENYQTADGRVRIPDVLQPYLGKDSIG